VNGSWVFDDGGRAAAGFKGKSGDCVIRAAAIITGTPYATLYDMVVGYAEDERIGKRKKGKSDPQKGVYKRTTRKLYADLDLLWHPTMLIGSGCQVHLRADELPSGRVITQLTKHACALIDGVIHDTHDPSRFGTRCVYGYWQPRDEAWWTK
jgi:hypothetical protein